MKLSKINQFTVSVVVILVITGLIFLVIPGAYFENEATKAKTELTLSVIIGLFAVMEGFSTALQYYESSSEFRLKELRYSLENLYGPLNQMFAYSGRIYSEIDDVDLLIVSEDERMPTRPEDERITTLSEDESREFKRIISTYRYLLPQEDFVILLDSFDARVYVPEGFVTNLQNLYDEKLKEYYDFIDSQ